MLLMVIMRDDANIYKEDGIIILQDGSGRWFHTAWFIRELSLLSL